MQCCVVYWKLTYGFIKQPELCKEINLLVIMSQTVSGLGKKITRSHFGAKRVALIDESNDVTCWKWWKSHHHDSHIIWARTCHSVWFQAKSTVVQLQWESSSIRNQPNCRKWTKHDVLFWSFFFFVSCSTDSRGGNYKKKSGSGWEIRFKIPGPTKKTVINVGSGPQSMMYKISVVLVLPFLLCWFLSNKFI